MAQAWKCDICGSVSTLFIEGVRYSWYMGECPSPPMVAPIPLDVCTSCYRFLEVEMSELRLRIAKRKEESGRN